MAEILREQAQWRKGKSPVIGKYISDHAKLLAEIAGRGFLSLPGYAYALNNDLELATKQGLSDVNYKILEETITRELKQLGIDYNFAYKNAVIVWELEKQDLMTAWDRELSGIKQWMAADEEVLNRLAIEVSKRSITLLEGKTTLELAMEGYRQTLVTLDGTTASYEVQLANAKLLTAQKKLLLIPILQQIIVKEQELLVIERTKAADYTLYMGAEQRLAAKKETLSPIVNDLATKVETYADNIITEQIPIEKSIADEKVTQAGIAVEKAEYQADELMTEIEIEEKNLDLMDEKRTLQKTQFDNEQSLISTELDLTTKYHETDKTQFETLLTEEKGAITQIVDDKEEIHTTQKDMRIKSVQTITKEQIKDDNSITGIETNKTRLVADTQAAAHITAALEHLIG